MKKVFGFGITIIMTLFFFTGCGPAELKQGIYMTDDQISQVEILENNEYVFVRHVATSYCPAGKYSIERGKLILHAGEEKAYVFKIKNGTLILETDMGGLVEPGTIFKLT